MKPPTLTDSAERFRLHCTALVTALKQTDALVESAMEALREAHADAEMQLQDLGAEVDAAVEERALAINRIIDFTCEIMEEVPENRQFDVDVDSLDQATEMTDCGGIYIDEPEGPEELFVSRETEKLLDVWVQVWASTNEEDEIPAALRRAFGLRGAK